MKAGTDSQHHVKALTRMHFVKKKKKKDSCSLLAKVPKFPTTETLKLAREEQVGF